MCAYPLGLPLSLSVCSRTRLDLYGLRNRLVYFSLGLR